MNRHPDKCRHPFDTQKGRPPYWLRNDVEDIKAHWKLIQAHERVHVRKLKEVSRG